jgi:hypothetical protein
MKFPRLRTCAESLYHEGKNRAMPRFRRPYEIVTKAKILSTAFGRSSSKTFLLPGRYA